MSKEYDLVILGGGTGGYVAAIRASQLGMKVAVVEAEKLGGTCLHHGCIPSKSLLRTAEMYRQMQDALTYGIEVNNLQLIFPKAQERKDKIVNTLYQGVQSLMKKNGIDVYQGYGRILGPSIFSPMPGTISVEYKNGQDNTMLIPKFVLIATGSTPRPFPGMPFDGEHILNSDHALQLTELPSSILIIGGGVIGIEWASMLQDLGVEVTVIENNKTILAGEDLAVQQEVLKALESRGVTILTDTAVESDTIEINDSTIRLSVNTQGKQQNIEVDKLLVSIGREANISEIGLTNTSIQIKNNVIQTNEMYQTKESHIYAIGDCIGGMQLAHVASAEGIIAVEHMAGKSPDPLNPLQIPACIYSFPEVGKVGLTEQQAKDAGYDIKVGTFPFQGIGKAHVYGEPIGFTKIIVDQQTEDILGVHMVGSHVTDLISEASLAKVLDATAWEISKTVHPHPTLSEVFLESALAVDHVQIHG
ncbi:dihydrolipoyl dehydrogenase [Pseudogracilibacillus sp. SE30717A]|uniref:dihydrolipoyl dehydrogenase n=1 Tax=Pseudogracilibacillus sp. SE30717A TaxID=3098293 RepID=UPI00300E1749